MSRHTKDEGASSALGDRFRVAGWTVDVRALEISNGEETRRLEPKVMGLLAAFAARPGEVFRREELEELLWHDLVVSYDSLTTAVIKLRKAFGDHAKQPGIIETVPKVGYRLVADVVSESENSGEDGRTVADDGWLARARWPAAVTGVTLVAVLAGWLMWQLSPPAVGPVRIQELAYPLPDKPSIAVLPFDNLSGDPDHDYLVEGLGENVTTELSRFKEFFVIARTSAVALRGEPVNIVAEELGVRYVVEGSVQAADDSVRVTVQLIDAVNGRHLWAERFDRDLSDVFTVQDEVTRTIAATLDTSIDLAERARVKAKPVESLQAYELVKRGRDEWMKFTKETTQESNRLGEKALEIDPDYSRAYVHLAWGHLNGYRWGWSDTYTPEESLELALKMARKAIELDPFYYQTHWALAAILTRSGDLERAVMEYDRTLELNPNASDVLADSAGPLCRLGQAEEAIHRLRTAMRLNPKHPEWYFWQLGWLQYFAGKYEDALVSIRKMNTMPNEARRVLAPVLIRLGRLEEARTVMAEFLENEPGYSLEDMKVEPFKHREYLERWTKDLRAAGVPEHPTLE